MPDNDLEKAKITVLWIGENDPDTFSSYIQYRLGLLTLPGWWSQTVYTIKFLFGRADYLVKFSHNAFIFEGHVWHGTISDDEEFSGFCREPIEHALKDSVVRYCQEVTTRFTNAEMRVYLNARKGTPYGLVRSNIPNLHPWVLNIPFFGRKYWRTGKNLINCSEVAAEGCDGGTIAGQPEPLSFGDLDLCSPLTTKSILKPEVCNHSHLTNS